MTWSDIYRAFVGFFVSLRLTVALLALSIILVFWATLEQAQLGVWGVQEKFFRSLIVLSTVPGTQIPLPVFPGGYFIGGLLMINLIASHVHRFKFTWKKSGIQLTHFGLIILLVGELITGLLQEDYSMRLGEGETKNYSESFRRHELVIVDTSDPDYDNVVAIPESLVKDGDPVQHPQLPFRVQFHGYLPNSDLQLTANLADSQTAQTIPNPADQGVGPRISVIPLPVTYRDNERNLPTAWVELIGADGPLGTWLVSPLLLAPQEFEYAGKSWRIGMRIEREYKPFALTLLELRHDVYAGSSIPKNFSSRVRIETNDGTENREALIYMNNPLRLQGLTFYQYQMDSANGFSVLQVVRNPGRALPYIACVLMGLGLTIQFGIHLVGFTTRRRKA